MSRTEAADQALASASQSQQAADRSAVAAFWSRYTTGASATGGSTIGGTA
jgi:hypothetical protein